MAVREQVDVRSEKEPIRYLLARLPAVGQDVCSLQGRIGGVVGSGTSMIVGRKKFLSEEILSASPTHEGWEEIAWFFTTLCRQDDGFPTDGRIALPESRVLGSSEGAAQEECTLILVEVLDQCEPEIEVATARCGNEDPNRNALEHVRNESLVPG